jgi:hypothetical protein
MIPIEMTDAMRRCMHREPTLKPNANHNTNDTGATAKLEQEEKSRNELKQFALSTACDIVLEMNGNTKPLIVIKCKTCGVDFSPSPPCLSKTRKFCSLPCAYKSRDRVKHVQKKERGERVCLKCKKVFRVHTKAPNAQCCSRQCNGSMIGKTSMGINRRKQPCIHVVEKQCKTCGIGFRSAQSSKRIYCSSKCSANDNEMQSRRIETLNSKPRPTMYSSARKGWVEFAEKRIFARSRWEANYARYLEWMKSIGEILEWDHEPRTFWFEKIKRGVRSYLPDFRVVMKSGAVEWHEVKGWMDSKSATKIKRMAKYYPKETLRIFSTPWFKDATRNLAGIIPGWEKDSKSANAKPRKAKRRGRR